MDFAGVVTKVGSGVKRAKTGDEVWGSLSLSPAGSFAEYVAVSEENIALKPKNVSFADAASIGVVGLTGYSALLLSCQVSKGQKVLILGGSGGTGTFAIQFAKHVLGAYVATTCSEWSIELLKGLGADQTINYREEDWSIVLEGQNYDVVYDCVGGGDHYNKSKRILKPGGKCVTIVGDEAVQPPLTVGNLATIGWRIASRKVVGVFGGIGYDFVLPKPTPQQFDELSHWMEEEKIKAVLDRTYDLEDVLEAFELQHSARARGKIVLTVKQEESAGKEETGGA